MAELTGKAISELPAAATINDTDLLVLSQNGASKKVTPPVLLSGIEGEISGLSGSLATFVRPNLLDNWYFIGGGSQLGGGVLPINQRGQASYTQNGYSIDRWSIDGYVSLVVASNCIKLSKSVSDAYRGMRQPIKVSGMAGRTVTFSVLCSSGTTGQFRMTVIDKNSSVLIDTYPAIEAANTKGIFTTTFVATSDELVVYVRPYNVSLNIYAVKLELGDSQTLAHQESGAWVLNEIPDFGEQLAKCQRYFVRLDPGIWHNYGYVVPSGETAGTATIVLPQAMVANPNVVLSGSILAKNAVTNTTATGSLSQNTVTFNITSTGMTLFSFLPLRNGSNGGHIDFSAES